VHSPKVVIDTSRFPLIVERFHRGVTDQDVDYMIRQFELLFHGGRRYALLVYCDPDAVVMSAAQRKRVSQWYRDCAEQVKRINVATAVVLESQLVRGAMTALNWLVEPVVQQKNVPNVREGLIYCIGALEAAKLAVPPEVLALRDATDLELKKFVA
jgi:hypothetical protein